MRYDDQKLKGLFTRVYNDKMQEQDGNDIVELIKRTFGTGMNPDPSMIWQFNNLLVQQADEISKPMVTDVVSLLALYKSVAKNSVAKYTIPKIVKAKVRWSANGSGVDLVRVGGQDSFTATPKAFSTGFYYEPFGDDADAVTAYRNVVNDLANAKLRLYMAEIRKLVDAAIASNKIPTKNVVSAANTTLAQFNGLVSVLQRYGGRPVFIADSLLIDHFANLQTTDPTASKLLTDKVKEELLQALNPMRIGRADAMNLVNPFIDDANSKVELPVNVGYMLTGGDTKPFYVTEFGGMRQSTEQNIEDERIKLKITQDADITLMFGQALGFIKDDSVTL